jgi:hypothetical protein
MRGERSRGVATQICVVLRKEMKNFLGSGRSMFAIYAFLMFFWGFIFVSNGTALQNELSVVFLLIFFAVIVSATFANTVFLAERINGTLEIWLCSGIARSALLLGKIVYIVIMSTILGCGTLLFSMGQSFLFGFEIQQHFTAINIGLFVAAALFNTTLSSWLSIILPQPRLLHIVNIFITGFVVSVSLAFLYWIELGTVYLLLILCVLSSVVLSVANREWNGEKIIQPIHL